MKKFLKKLLYLFHNQILNYEDHYNHHLLTINDETPLLDLLKEKTYLDSLQLDDYFILGLELYLEEHNYDDLKVYHFNELIQEIKNDLTPDLREIERLDFKILHNHSKNLQIIKSLKIIYLILFQKKKNTLIMKIFS